MSIAIIILLVLAIFFKGSVKFWWGDWKVTIDCNWLALAGLILYLIEKCY